MTQQQQQQQQQQQPAETDSDSAAAALQDVEIGDSGGGAGTAAPAVVVVAPGSDDDLKNNDGDSSKRHGGGWCCCCSWCSFDGLVEAQGYNLLGVGRGAVVMSNIFLASSLIYLASEEAGCVDTATGAVIEDCDTKVRGFRPASLITNIAVISGLLAAFFMPMIGAIIDYTPYRRLAGIVAAVLIGLIQTAQIGTVQSTWFVMAILQAIAGFIYQAEVVTTYAYLPDMAGKTDETNMTKYTGTFTMFQFAAQATFLVVVIAVSTGFGMNDVTTAHFSQAFNVIWISIFLGIGWKTMPRAPAKHELTADHRLVTEGFIQTFRTAKKINTHFRHGLKWYLLAVVFAEASAAAITTVSVVYLDEAVGLTSTQIGIFFLVTLIFTLPGAKWLAPFVTNRTNPNTSWKISMMLLTVALIVGAILMDRLGSMKELSYIWAAFMGVCLGHFYPTENLFFSLCLPKGQEAELAGFFVYCTQILSWLPPLLFTVLVENGVNQKWGVVVTAFGFPVAIGFLSMTTSWEGIIEEASQNRGAVLGPVDDDGKEKEGLDEQPSNAGAEGVAASYMAASRS